MRGVTNAFEIVEIAQTISTHTPHARRDSATTAIEALDKAFQLTRLMRGVTQGSHFK